MRREKFKFSKFSYSIVKVFLVFTLIFILFFTCGLCALLTSCLVLVRPSSSSQDETTVSVETPSSEEVTLETSKATDQEFTDMLVDEVYRELKSGSYFILDVRTPEEFKEGYIEGAILIPLAELESRLYEIPKDKPIIVYCRSGRRSASAEDILVKNGFREVYNMKGGITAWISNNYPVVKGE